MVRFRAAGFNLAIDLHSISSLVDDTEIEGVEIVDVGERLGGDSTEGRQFGLLTGSRAIAVPLGDEISFETWQVGRVAALPGWLGQHLSPVLRPACGLGEHGRLVFIIDADSLRKRAAVQQTP